MEPNNKQETVTQFILLEKVSNSVLPYLKIWKLAIYGSKKFHIGDTNQSFQLCG